MVLSIYDLNKQDIKQINKAKILFNISLAINISKINNIAKKIDITIKDNF